MLIWCDVFFFRSFLSEAQKALEDREKELEKMKNAVHQQTTEGEEREEAITSRESQRCFRAEGDSELRATLTLQREWRKMASRVSGCISE